MKYITTALIIAFTISSILAQTNHYIAFSAKEDGVGHAFVTLGYEDSDRKMTVHDGSWGLYPIESVDGAKSFLVGEVPGRIKDDFLTQKDLTLIVVITESEYSNALKTLDKWRNKNYELLKSDCLTFVIEMARVINNKLNVPDREGFDNLPAKYIEKLIKSNKQ